MSAKTVYGNNNTVKVVSSGASVKKPTVAGATYAGNIGIPSVVKNGSGLVSGGGTYGSYFNSINPNLQAFNGGGVTKEGVITVNPSVERMPSYGGANSADALKYTPAAGVPSSTQKYYSSPSVMTVSNAGNTAGASDASAEQPAPASASATENSTPMTYEEYIEEAKKGYQAQLDAAQKQAEQTRQRAVVDAQSSYAQNLASYGAKAEEMAGSGMQGGGYSDYLNSQAYAQKRADVQRANAQAAETKQAAEGTYQDYINGLNQQLAQKALDDQRLADQREYEQKQIEDERQYQKEVLAEQRNYEEDQQRDSIYAELLQGVLDPNSTYTAEAIDEFAREYGLDEGKVLGLKNMLAATQAKSESEKNAQLKQQALDAINEGALNESNIDSYLNSLGDMGASEENIADIREAYQNTYYNNFLSDITNGVLSSTKEVDDAFRAGNISQEQYDALKKAWNDDINTASNAFDQFGSYEEAKKAYEDIIKDSWCSADTKASLKKTFESYEAKKFESNVSSGYNAYSSTVTLNTPNGKVTVTYGVNSKSLKSSSGNAVFSSSVYKNAKSGQVFIVNGRPYVKLDNGDLGWVNDYWGQGAYESLLNTFKGTVYDIS